MAKIMISIPDDLLKRIDREVKRRKTSRSALLRQGAMREIGSPDPEVFDAALARARAVLASVEHFDVAAAVRTERDKRDARDRHRL